MARGTRWIVRLFGALLAIAGIALAAARLWLETPKGERWLARELSRRVSGAIAGDFHIERVDVRGVLDLEARGVELRLGKARVAQADRVAVELAWSSLLGPRTTVDRLEIGGLELEVAPVEGQARLGVVAALGPPPTEEASRPPAAAREGGVTIRGLQVDIDEVAIRPTARAEPSWLFASGEARGRVETHPGSLALDARVDVRLAAPIEGPVGAYLVARIENGQLELTRLDATLPGGIHVTGGTAPAPGGARPSGADASFEVRDLRVAVEIPADGLVPYGGPALGGALEVTGQLSYRGGRIDFDVTGEPSGPGEIRADGFIVRGAPGRFAVFLDARGVDPSRLLPRAPEGLLWTTFDASGTTSAPFHLEGELRVAPSRIRGVSIGPGGAHVALRAERIVVRDAALEVPGGNVSGRLAATGGRPDSVVLGLSVRDLRAFASVPRALGVAVPELEGALTARVRVSGAVAREIAVEARSPRLAVSGRELEKLDLLFRVDGARARLDLRGLTGDGRFGVEARAVRLAPTAFRVDALSVRLVDAAWRLRRSARLAWSEQRIVVQNLVLVGAPSGNLSLELDVPRQSGTTERVMLALRIVDLPLATVRPLVRGALPRGTTVSGAVAVMGTVSHPDARGEVRVQMTADRQRDLEARFEIDASRGSAHVSGEVDMRPGPRAFVAVRLRAPERRALWEPGALRASHLDARLTAPAVDLGRLSRLGILPATVRRGTLRADLRASGAPATADVHGQFRVSGLVLGPSGREALPPMSGDIRLDADRASVRASVDAHVSGMPPLRAEGHAFQGALALLGRERSVVPFRATLEVPRGPVELHRPRIRAAGLELRVMARGTLGTPQIEFRAAARALAARGADIGDITLDANISSSLTAARIGLAPASGGDLAVSVRIPEDEAWTAEMHAAGAHLDFLEALPRFGQVADAVASGSLRVRGPPDPLITGRVTVQAREAQVRALATLREVDVRIRADGRSIDVDRLAVSIGRGRAEARGKATWDGRVAHGAFHVRSERLAVPIGPRPVGEVTTSVDARFDLAGRDLTGTIHVAPGEARLPDGLPGDLHPLSLPSDVVVHHGGAKADARNETPTTAYLERLRARIAVVAPGDFWIRSEAANLEVRADLVALWNGERLAFTGDVVVPRGTLNVIRRRFEVERVELTFRGDPDVDPALSGRLAFASPTVDVSIDLSGTLREPELQLTSDPPMDAADVARLVAVGDGGTAGNTAVTGAVLSGALNLVAGRVSEALSAQLPLDVLAVALGPRGEARRVEAGAYLTPKLFVSVVRNLLAEPDENTNEVRAEYELNRRLSVSTRYGDGQSGGVDLLWERRFRSAEQRAEAEVPGLESTRSDR